ncbi:MAG: peptidylprolyl isomerase [Betaproteobacteria bacterium]|jgi:cyclophilin family peptidyl-prolyl cis-trans isomerase|nr:peptidylprolyl isomerase [Betaproteobacteria bacterium]
MTRQLLASLACALCTLVAHAADPKVELKTNLGDIVLELNAELAPKTVANFLRYVQDGHYNGTIFHRVIEGFMIQGGGMDEALAEKPTRAPIENEANNGLKNETGTVAMARTNDPHSARAQFFINVAGNDFLNFNAPDSSKNWGYAVFGKVVKGMDIVQKIEKRPTQTQGMHESVPINPVIIESATVLENIPENKPVIAPATKSKGSASTKSSKSNKP